MKKIIVFCTLAFALFVTCKKNQLDGKSRIHGVVAHHEKKIPFATVFIKFNAKDSPGSDTSAYDAKVRADKDGHYDIKCYKGDYFLYGYGYDYSIDSPFVVVGGVPVHLRNKEDREIAVAVTED
ncbi:MAG TPA: hypothetical protein PL029_10005 [Bacteroidia bacterium]|nr:hypothetical protein [Bacteroidia bacterium]